MKLPTRVVVVLGPRTRLGCCLLDAVQPEEALVRLVARSREELKLMQAEHPECLALPAWNDAWSWPATCEQLAVFVCAAGVIHPRASRWPEDGEAARRDVEVLRHIFEGCRQARVRAILVSTVLALAGPRCDRTAYVGWKCLVEDALGALVRDHPRASLTVYYPGKLVKERTLAAPLSLLHTSYSSLARRMSKAAVSHRSGRRVVGLDARLWLLERALKTLWGGTRGGPWRRESRP